MDKNEISFTDLVSDIQNHNKYKKLKHEFHHGINRYTHSIRVAKVTYFLSKLFKFDYKSATRGAMLHDFFSNEEYGNVKGLKTAKVHPHIACLNAKNTFNLNDIEQDVISSHMYPINTHRPSYKESWLVNTVDEGVSLYEMTRYQLSGKLTIFILFIMNMILFGQK